MEAGSRSPGCQPAAETPLAHDSHFQALGSAQAPGNSFHLLSSTRPLTLCSHLPGSLSAAWQTQPPNPAHSTRLRRWGINPLAMPFPAQRNQEGAWPGRSTNHCQVSPAHLWVTCLRVLCAPT